MAITLIRIIFGLLNLIIFADIIVSFFLSPYNIVRSTLDKIVNPLLSPIRRILPPTGMLDFSPIVLILLLQLLEYIVLIPFR